MLVRCTLALVLLILSATAHAQPLSVEDVFRPPAFANPAVSPDGRYLAVTTPVRGRLNIVVLDLDTRQAQGITSFADFDVIDLRWVGTQRLVFSVGQYNSPTGPGAFEGGGLFVVDRDGKNFRVLAPTVREARARGQFVYRGYQFLRTIPGNDEEIVVTGNQDVADTLDLYRLNLRSGRATLMSLGRPAPLTFRWVLDSRSVPRVVTAMVRDTTTAVVWHRAGAEAKWEEIARYDVTRGPSFVPLAFEADDRTLQVAWNGERETMAIFRYDPATRKFGEVVAQHPRFDMGAHAGGGEVAGVLQERDGRIVGYAVDAERPQQVWTDADYARVQRTLDGALPDTVNSFTRTPDGKRYIVTARSDVRPVRWYLFDEANRKLEELFASRPWIKPGQLAAMRPFVLKTRDGLEIPSYYFLPADHQPGTRLPTVVHLHGGPAVRADAWGEFTFGVMEAQLLAARGYAVVLPNFRITPGFGARAYYSGFGQLGRRMIDDHADAARWAVDAGFADPARICLSGASYGGYATLLALARYPDLFRCGVAGLVVADVPMLLTSPAGDIAATPAAVEFWKQMLGVRRLEDIAPDQSPVNVAGRIRQPVLMYAGADDIRTPLEQTRAMAAALTRAGNAPREVIVKAEEGHGFGRLANNVELYDKVLQFLDTHLGVRRAPPAASPAPAAAPSSGPAAAAAGGSAPR